MLVDQRKLELYVNNNYNVLFEGQRGVGKTSIISSTFLKAGYRVKYFSAPTMDPWTDLVGVPSTVTREDGKEVLRLIPPEDFVDDKYDVIFIDELNRAPKKVMNALMELMQFKTINGKPYNIKMIWAAINPHTEDEEYHVEPLDPAVKDRFQIHIKIPYEVDVAYFKKSYGQVGEIFCNWWQNQPEAVQKEISPRRLFDSVQFHLVGGDLADMITVGNTQKLKEDLKSASQLIILEKDFNAKTVGASKGILSKNYPTNVANYFRSNREIFEFFLPHLDKEWLSKEFLSKSKVHDLIMKIGTENSDNAIVAKDIIKDIVCMNPGKNPFVKKNFEQFKEFMTEEVKEAYVQKAAATKALIENSLIPDSNAEKTLVSLIDEQGLMKKSWKLSGSDIKIFNWNKMRNVTNKAISAAKSNSITIERAKEQIAERIGIVFALISAETSINDSIQKTFDSFLDPSVSSYIWKKNDIDTQFLDMNDRIQKVMDKYAGLTSEEIKSTYSELTARPSQRKKSATVNKNIKDIITPEEYDSISDKESYVAQKKEAYNNPYDNSYDNPYDKSYGGGWMNSKPKKRGY
jgi:hypothetical protein